MYVLHILKHFFLMHHPFNESQPASSSGVTQPLTDWVGKQTPLHNACIFKQIFTHIKSLKKKLPHLWDLFFGSKRDVNCNTNFILNNPKSTSLYYKIVKFGSVDTLYIVHVLPTAQ